MRCRFIAGFLVTAASLAPAAYSQPPAGAVSAQFSGTPGLLCSNMTPKGLWGVTIEGSVVGSSSVFRGLDLAYFDGKGHITQVDHLVNDGVPPTEEWTQGTGTYSVNPDCTGSAVINSGSTPYPVVLHFIIVDSGRKMLQVVDANAVVAIGYRVI
jgi:hypothetical protein